MAFKCLLHDMSKNYLRYLVTQHFLFLAIFREMKFIISVDQGLYCFTTLNVL